MADRALPCASDDVNQPVDKQAAGEFDGLVASCWSASPTGRSPRWKDTSFFKRFAK